MLNFFVKAFEFKIKFHTDSGLSEPNFERPGPRWKEVQ